MLIIRMNFIDATSGIVLSVSGRPVYRLGENSRWSMSKIVLRCTVNKILKNVNYIKVKRLA